MSLPALDDDDFALFDLPRKFAQDGAVIDQRWKDLQREAHPDRFAASGVAAQRVAMQWSVRINEAHARLKDPLRRAAYLCELNAAPINAHTNTSMPPAFLMQQMQWREALDEASGEAELDAIAAEVARSREDAMNRVAILIDADQDFAGAAAQIRALMFIERFGQELDARYDALGQ